MKRVQVNIRMTPQMKQDIIKRQAQRIRKIGVSWSMNDEIILLLRVALYG